MEAQFASFRSSPRHSACIRTRTRSVRVLASQKSTNVSISPLITLQRSIHSIQKLLVSTLRSFQATRSIHIDELKRTLAISSFPPLLLASISLSSIWSDLTSNTSLVAGFYGWLIAQVMKVFTYKYKSGEWNLAALIESGGMPSSHSALCVAVTTSLAATHGLSSPLFTIALCFSLIVMYDAAGVRFHAGNQAEVLNVVVKELMEGHPVSEVQLKEVLGHTPLQVTAGAVVGVCCGLVFGVHHV